MPLGRARKDLSHSTRLASDNRGKLHFVIGSSIELLERDAVAGANDGTRRLQKQSGAMDGRDRVVVMKLSVAAHLVEMFLVVHRCRDDFARIRHRTPQDDTTQRHERRRRGEGARMCKHGVEMLDQQVAGRKRVAHSRQEIERG